MRLWDHIDRLDRPAWLLLVISGLYAVSTALSNTFVNVYLWKLQPNFAIIGYYNLANYLAVAITFVLAGRLTKQVDRVIAIRIGVALQALFYLAVLLLGNRSVEWVFLLGMFLGVGSGFFWLSYHVLYFEITERNNRDIYNGIHGLITSGAGILAPVISGWIITRIDHFTGYRLIFALSLVVFLVAVVVSFMLSRRSASGVYRLKEILCLAFDRQNHWYWVNLAMVAQGIREGLFAFLISLLIFVATGNELSLGGYLTASSAIAFIAYFMVGRFIKIRWRDESILIGAVMLGVVALPLLWDVNTWALVVLGWGIALFYPLYLVPFTSVVFDVIGENQETARLRVEYVVARELAFNVGRVFSVATFLWWVQGMSDPSELRWLVLSVGFVQLFAWLAIRRVPLLEQEP